MPGFLVHTINRALFSEQISEQAKGRAWSRIEG